MSLRCLVNSINSLKGGGWNEGWNDLKFSIPIENFLTGSEKSKPPWASNCRSKLKKKLRNGNFVKMQTQQSQWTTTPLDRSLNILGNNRQTPN